jgi:cell division septum initiation protein DivIVA
MSKEKDIIEVIESYQDEVDNLPVIPIVGKVMVDRAEIIKILEEIKYLLPGELHKIKHAEQQSGLIMEKAERESDRLRDEAYSQKEEIIQSAQEEYNRIIRKAKEDAERLVDEHEIVQEAKLKYKEITNEADRQKRIMKEESYAYAMEILSKLRANVADLLDTVEDNLDELDHLKD